jgi:OOP family OmpA-OmpF porin
MVRLKLWWLILFFFPGCLAAQTADSDPNLVPNPSFERFAAPPLGWFYKGAHFTRLVRYWSAPTIASPDAFGPRVVVPTHWKDRGFGEMPPYHGKAMAGITVYGCTDGKPHCREYIQVPLSTPMEPGESYQLSFKAAHLPKSLSIDKLGMALSKGKINEADDKLLELPPAMIGYDLLESPDEVWHTVSETFEADKAYSHLIIGNFFPDSLTNTYSSCEDYLNYAYYYIDQVKVTPLTEPINLLEIFIEVGQTTRLSNIYFDTDKSALLPTSTDQLENLLELLQKYPSLEIQVIGHTDALGTADYNQELSERRAAAVIQYLQQNGINARRLRSVGFGNKRPIASNKTEEGRKKNRRVEFKVLKK